MNYLGIISIATTLTLALLGYGSSSMNKVDAKIESNKAEIAQVRVDMADRLGRIETKLDTLTDVIVKKK